jgi:ADP-ribose pyrophosphatase YjhB (NUDIX family)
LKVFDFETPLETALIEPMIETKSAGGVVLNRQGQVLVVSQRGRSWSLPKGHVEPGEGLLAAAQREIYEESGVRELIYIRLLGSYSRKKIAKDGGEDGFELKHLTFFLFECSVETLAPVDPDNPEARWVNKEDVASLLTHEKDREFFLSILPALDTRP